MRELDDSSALKRLDISTNAGEARRFTISANGFIFRNLMGGLYSDKVKSVLREIVSNAIDAHAMAQGTRPSIIVSIPSYFSPYLTVRDFGDSMTDEFVTELYTCVGHSEKRQTNAATGMFGLGSKSPFAICEQFEVTTFIDEIKTIYHCFYDVDGTPAIMMRGKFDAPGEHNGTLVSIPVDQDDIIEFEAALSHNARAYFDKDITFNRVLRGDTEDLMDKIKSEAKLFIPGLFQIASKTKTYGHGDVYVRQGTAIYELDLDKLTIDSVRRACIELLTRDANDLFFDAPIGSFNVTPSREAISYDGASIASLHKIFFSLLDAARAHMTAVCAGCTTRMEAYNAVLNRTPTSSHSLRDWQRASIIVDFTMRNRASDPAVIFPATHPVKVETYSGSIRTNGLGSTTRTSKNATTHCPTPCIAFVIPHGIADWEEKFHRNAASLTPDTVILTQYEGYPTRIFRVRAVGVQATIDFLKANYNFVEVIDASSLANIVSGYTTNAPYTQPKYTRAHVYLWEGSKKEWATTKTVVDFSKPAYYVVRNGAQQDNLTVSSEYANAFDAAQHHDGKFKLNAYLSTPALNTVLQAAGRCGAIDPTLPLYRLTKAQYEAVAVNKANGLIPLVQTIVDHVIQQDNFDKVLANYVEAEFDAPYHNSLASGVFQNIRDLDEGDELTATEIRMLNDDTFALNIGILARRADGYNTNDDLRNIYGRLFSGYNWDDHEAVKAVTGVTNTSRDRFRLVDIIVRPLVLDTHLELYINAILNDPTQPAIKLSDYPVYEKYVLDLRAKLCKAEIAQAA